MKTTHQTKNRAAQWMAGMAVASAGTSSAALVQIDLINNNFTLAEPNNLNADLTGSGSADISINNVFSVSYLNGAGYATNPEISIGGYNTGDGVVNAMVGGNRLFARAGTYPTVEVILGAQSFNTSTSGNYVVTGELSGFIAVTFDATAFGGNAAEQGLLNVSTFAEAQFSAPGGQSVNEADTGVFLNFLIFNNDAGTGPLDPNNPPTGATLIGSTEDGMFSPVPEPSSLALMALGAGGLLVRRQRKKAS